MAEHAGPIEGKSLLGVDLHALPEDPHHEPLHEKLREAGRRLEAAERGLQVAGDDPHIRTAHAEAITWFGRRLGYLWRMREALAVFTKALEIHPGDPSILRHRAHRHLSLREFDEALADLESARDNLGDRAREVEVDGIPNAHGVNLTTLGFNVWYHLGLARYLKGDFSAAIQAFRQTLHHCRRHDDNLVAVADWLFMCLRRAGRDEEATHVLEWVRPHMTILENHAYHRRLLMYKGLLSPDELCDPERASELNLATLGYGLGLWRQLNGSHESAREVWKKIVAGPYWPAFGFIASEVELANELGGEKTEVS